MGLLNLRSGVYFFFFFASLAHKGIIGRGHDLRLGVARIFFLILRKLFIRKPFFIGCYCSSKMAADTGYMRACDWFSFSVVLTSWGGSPCRIKQGREAKSSGSKEILVFDL